jgi:hypothetical protein
MNVRTTISPGAFRVLPPLTGRQRPWRLVERNVLAYRRTWWVFITGFFEPVLFLLSRVIEYAVRGALNAAAHSAAAGIASTPHADGTAPNSAATIKNAVAPKVARIAIQIT